MVNYASIISDYYSETCEYFNGKQILWKSLMIQEFVHERAAIYFNFLCKYLKSCSLKESELCLMLTLTCGLTSLHSLGPSYSPWLCPDITGL